MNFIKWLNEQEDYGLCSPPLPAQEAVNILKDYLLGEGWYVAFSQNTEQTNTDIVFQILKKHSKRFRKDLKKHLKRRNKNES